ncbi:MAG: FAD-linked oxidase C-terminal domain-containing protein [Thermodesulfobacteriota bacterium]
MTAMMNEAAKRRFEAILGPDYFSTRLEDLVLFSSDGTNQRGYRPDGVARPADTAEVAALVRTAREFKIPIIPRGAGSGLSGGALPVAGGLVVVMTRFNRILEIDADNLVAEVEPGVVTSDFQAAVEARGLFFPPDPASREFSTLGGNAAENAGGTRAVKYGVTRDYILGLEAVIGTGEIVRAGVRTAKGVVGYDLTRLLVGSEGTLGVITKLTLKLLPAPEARETLIAYYADMADAGRTVAALTAARIIPATLEFMDRASINCAEDYLGLGLDRNAGALLLIETDGPREQARLEAERAARLCRENSAHPVRLAETKAEAEAMWRARRALSPALFRAASGKFNEDIVVPRSLIPEMIARVEAIARELETRIICFGHAGDGNIHVNVMYDLHDPDQTARAHRAVRAVFETALTLGGTLSGEHGIGTTKKEYISLEIKPETLDLMRRIKAAFDPDGLMNPGKVFPSGSKPDR